MSRRQLIAGNWKMNKTVSEALALVRDLKRLVASVRDCDIMITPPYPALHPVAKRLEDSNIQLGAQELHPEDSGAFTGAVSGPMLKEVGCQYVLVGHSERRQIFGETLESARQRMAAVFRAELMPVLCIGETLEEREAGRTMDVVGEQLVSAIEGLGMPELHKTVIAYEPVWAIGTGKVATPEQAQEVHGVIREQIRRLDPDLGEQMRILYGGSVKPSNAHELLHQPDIDGALVGGASLEAESFAGIVKGRRPA